MIKSTNYEAGQAVKRKRMKTPSTTRAKTIKKTDHFSRDELNLRVDLHPLSHYIPDRDNLVDQLFTILSDEELQRMIPATLQNYSVAEMKERITAEARNMVDEEILKIIESSGTFKNDPKTRKPADVVDIPQEQTIPESIQEECPEQGPKGQDTLELCPDQGEIDSLIEMDREPPYTKETAIPVVSSKGTVDLAPVGKEWVSSLAKSQLEILELEMRARAIRSLMKAQGMPDPDEDMEEELVLYKPHLDRESTIGSESSSSSSECETCASGSDDEQPEAPEEETVGRDDQAENQVDETMVVESVPVKDVQEPPGIDDNPTQGDMVESPVEQPEVVVEVALPVEEEVLELLTHLVSKVVFDDMEQRKKLERRQRRNMRNNKKTKVPESDIEEGQILENSDSEGQSD